MTTIQVVAPTAFKAGDVKNWQGAVPDNVNHIVLRVDRSAWTGPTTPGNALSATAYVSADNGVTWQLVIGFTTLGGTLYKGQRQLAYTPGPTETPIQESSASTNLPPGTGRIFKAELDVFLDLTTAIAIDLS